ncbi:MAG: hypothetical protein GY749_14860 [Desulfobacteraceae bacterium]|nr:hypothetical protein [Desulfobacteraceae bacterium]
MKDWSIFTGLICFRIYDAGLNQILDALADDLPEEPEPEKEPKLTKAV